MTIDRGRLREAVEWGGEPWLSMLGSGLSALGDLTGLRMLEIGARSGRLAALLAEQGAEVVALDISPGFEDAVRSEAARRGVQERVTPILDDGRLDAVRGQRFDVIVTKSVLVVIPDRVSYLTTMAALLAVKGRVLFIENGRGGRVSTLLRRLRRTGWDHRVIEYMDAAAVDDLRAIFDEELLIGRRLPPPIWLFLGSAKGTDPPSLR